MNHSSGISTLNKVNSGSVNLLNCEPGKVLVVDSHPFSRTVAVDLLSVDGYEVLEANTSDGLLERVLQNNPDLILLDLMMPQMDEFEACKLLKDDKRTNQIPVIFLTVSDDRKSRLHCFEAGGDDMLTKPLDSMALRTRVKSLIHQKRLNEGLDQTEQVLFSIASAIESRFSHSRNSCIQLATLAKSFGEYLQLPPMEIEDLICAAHLHDIGTVAIPDSVLLKKGELTPEERKLLNQHVLIGEQICQPLRNRRGVLPIIRHHHERWDGSGYPDGLAGVEIPFLAQVFQILDIYDALTSERPHKTAFTPTQALKIIAQEASKGWRNPKIVQQFTDFIHGSQSLEAS